MFLQIVLTLDNALSALCYIATALVLFAIGRLAYRLFQFNVNVGKELVEKDNLAFAVAHTGYYVGLLIALAGAIVGPSYGLLSDLILIFTYGLEAIILLNFAIIINDKLLLSRFSIRKEIIEDRNLGAGIIEGASAVATGLVVYGAVVGEGGGYLIGFVPANLEGYISALIFWLGAQLVLLLAGKVYQWITVYDVHDEIERDNVAAGIGFAGVLVAFGILIRAGIEGDFESFFDGAQSLAAETLIGIVMLPMVRLLTDRILLPGQKLTDEIVNQEHPNQGAAVVEAFAYVGGAMLIAICL
jgi:uncharacterized membrane protein YjfL (UPF0719 family)